MGRADCFLLISAHVASSHEAYASPTRGPILISDLKDEPSVKLINRRMTDG